MSTEPLHNKLHRIRNKYKKLRNGIYDIEGEISTIKSKISQLKQKLKILEERKIFSQFDDDETRAELNRQDVLRLKELKTQEGVELICTVRDDYISKFGFYNIKHLRLYITHLERTHRRVNKYDTAYNKNIKIKDLQTEIKHFNTQLDYMRRKEMDAYINENNIAEEFEIDIPNQIDNMYTMYACFNTGDERDIQYFGVDWDSIKKKKPQLQFNVQDIVKSLSHHKDDDAIPADVEMISIWDEEINTPVDHSSKILNKQVDSDVIDMSDIFGDEQDLTEDFDFG